MGQNKDGTIINRKVIVSVKGGENLSPTFVRDLKGVVERENAAFGVLICIAKVTKDMQREADDCEQVTTPVGTKHPKIQIYTIQKYFDGVPVDLPNLRYVTESPTDVPKKSGKQTSLTND